MPLRFELPREQGRTILGIRAGELSDLFCQVSEFWQGQEPALRIVIRSLSANRVFGDVVVPLWWVVSQKDLTGNMLTIMNQYFKEKEGGRS